MSTFVSVGNATQPFNRLLDAVRDLCSRLPQPVHIQYGSAQDINCANCANCHAVPFVDMEQFEKRVTDAELLILHAGAGSVIHAVRAGKIPVVMPRLSRLGEHIDDHQVEFARELSLAGKVVLCDDASQLEQAIRTALERQLQKRDTHEEPRLLGLIRNLLQNTNINQDLT